MYVLDNISNLSLRDQMRMHSSFIRVMLLPRPGLVFFASVRHPVQHVDHVSANCREKLVAME